MAMFNSYVSHYQRVLKFMMPLNNGVSQCPEKKRPILKYQIRLYTWHKVWEINFKKNGKLAYTNPPLQDLTVIPEDLRLWTSQRLLRFLANSLSQDSAMVVATWKKTHLSWIGFKSSSSQSMKKVTTKEKNNSLFSVNGLHGGFQT